MWICVIILVCTNDYNLIHNYYWMQIIEQLFGVSTWLELKFWIYETQFFNKAITITWLHSNQISNKQYLSLKLNHKIQRNNSFWLICFKYRGVEFQIQSYQFHYEVEIDTIISILQPPQNTGTQLSFHNLNYL